MTDRDGAGRATLFVCGDLMTGRGIDQIQRHPSGRRLFEPYVSDADEYVALAEAAGGPIPRAVPDVYIWGEALTQLADAAVRVRIANLETSVTESDDHWRGKGIHYRMHPDNIGCLTAARLDVCTLANNHVLDFGVAGLEETVATLARAGIRTAGAGATLAAAEAPAIVPLPPSSRVLVFAFGTPSSGIGEDWAARRERPGVNRVPDLSRASAQVLVARVGRVKRPGDVVVASIHWGNNWGYDVPDAHRQFAHWMIDGGVDLIHGHSSHHPRPIEIYRNRLILYGCGDFINDYEGIAGYEQYRDDIVLMYFPTVADDSGELVALRMVPMQLKAFRLNAAPSSDARWLCDVLARVSQPFGTRVDLAGEVLTAAPEGAAP
jgi:poly-gamma-glutamate capsule biosynthesis protein CapA/YwtB (metallophosphatase superfamily)